MFRSFFLAGFEGSTGYNRHGQWFDQVAATGHDRSVDQDYRDLAALGIHAARETVRWPLVDRGGRYDFSSLEPFARAARENGIEVIWDLFHYGYPQDVDLWGAAFPERFAEYCYAVARYLGREGEALYVTPVNEPSFMAYAGGEKGLFAPYGQERGWELKVALIARRHRRHRRHPARLPGSADRQCRSALPGGDAGRLGRTLPRRRATSTSASSSRAGTC